MGSFDKHHAQLRIAGLDQSSVGLSLSARRVARRETAKTDLERDVENTSITESADAKVSRALYDCKKPVIATINGLAVGVTMTLPLSRLAKSRTTGSAAEQQRPYRFKSRFDVGLTALQVRNPLLD